MFPIPFLPIGGKGISWAASAVASVVKVGVAKVATTVSSAIGGAVSFVSKKIRNFFNKIKEKALSFATRVSGAFRTVYNWMKSFVNEHKPLVVFTLQVVGFILMSVKHPIAMAVGASLIIAAGLISGDLKGALFSIGLGLIGLGGASALLGSTKLAMALGLAGRGLMFLSAIPYFKSALDKFKKGRISDGLIDLGMAILGLSEGPFSLQIRSIMKIISGSSFIIGGAGEFASGMKKLKEGRTDEGIVEMFSGSLDAVFGALIYRQGSKLYQASKNVEADLEMREYVYEGRTEEGNNRGNKEVVNTRTRENERATDNRGRSETDGGYRRGVSQDGRSRQGSKRSWKENQRESEENQREIDRDVPLRGEKYTRILLKNKYEGLFGKFLRFFGREKVVIIEDAGQLNELENWLSNKGDNRVLIVDANLLSNNFKGIDTIVFKRVNGKVIIDIYSTKTRGSSIEAMGSIATRDYRNNVNIVNSLTSTEIVNIIKKKHPEIANLMDNVEIDRRAVIIFDPAEYPGIEDLEKKAKKVEEIKSGERTAVIVYTNYVTDPKASMMPIERLKNAYRSIKKNLKRAYESARKKVDSFKKKVQNFINRAKLYIGNKARSLKRKISSFKNRIKSFGRRITEYIKRGISRVKRSIRNFKRRTVNFGKRVARYVKRGISRIRRGISRFRRKVVNFGRRVGRKIRSFGRLISKKVRRFFRRRTRTVSIKRYHRRHRSISIRRVFHRVRRFFRRIRIRRPRIYHRHRIVPRRGMIRRRRFHIRRVRFRRFTRRIRRFFRRFFRR